MGEIKHREIHYPGEHKAIIAAPRREAVQTLRSDNRVARARCNNVIELSLIAGLVFDGLVRKMTPSHVCKGARRYRYYVTHGDALQPSGARRWRALGRGRRNRTQRYSPI